MIRYMKGILKYQTEDSIIIENNGIGYEIHISGTTFEYLPDFGTEIKIYIYFQVREDAFVLYGFLTEDDLKVFQLLLSVNGVGPKGALAILSVLTPDDLRFAVCADDAKAIAKAQGIGAKTAQRVVLELKDKLKLEDAFAPKEVLNKNPDKEGLSLVKNEAILALTSLGYSNSEALKVLNEVDIKPEDSVEDVLKLALKQMTFL